LLIFDIERLEKGLELLRLEENSLQVMEVVKELVGIFAGICRKRGVLGGEKLGK
jgi:hypothetical protein